MGTLIGGLLFAAVMLWVALERVVARFQNTERGVASVRRDLADRRRAGDGQVEVTVWRAHPLSDHMIKELAKREGFRFTGEVSRYGSLMLRFVRTAKKAG
ncbi:hypothetical protein EIL87_07950 [Saccharopolyspora rhizosphaerae]|uniref:Uncharacterized protein n=1 Tax=Saccharopolyspora rhizosphaerae TaxID=2492662 RepID=A0A426JY96_9PSEU|nr:hypothetical protein [Saccharopolyspora rhizosphaerae]RRO18170.1 hypothetical protein EIL87_07950 [Saccharopolyspora rhizosphaerae]